MVVIITEEERSALGGRGGFEPLQAGAFALFDDSNQYDDYDGPRVDTRVSAFRAERGLKPSDTVMIDHLVAAAGWGLS